MDIVALGELLIDFVPGGKSDRGHNLFEENPGGAPGNMLAMANKLGHNCAMISKVGKDAFGDLLVNTLNQVGIDTRGVIRDTVNTTLAFVHLDETGDRDFSFYRKNSADVMLRADEVDFTLVDECKVFHFGTLTMTDMPVKEATQKSLDYAISKGKIISFDPNYRALLWDDENLAKEAAWYGIERCDILKIADNEIEWLTGEKDYDKAVAILKKRSKAAIINVTLGKDGAYCYYKDEEKVFEPAFKNEHTVDTTGAGDSFCGSVVSYVIDHGLELSKDELHEMLKRANAAASIVTQRSGAILSMPTKEEIEKRLI